MIAKEKSILFKLNNDLIFVHNHTHLGFTQQCFCDWQWTGLHNEGTDVPILKTHWIVETVITAGRRTRGERFEISVQQKNMPAKNGFTFTVLNPSMHCAYRCRSTILPTALLSAEPMRMGEWYVRPSNCSTTYIISKFLDEQAYDRPWRNLQGIHTQVTCPLGSVCVCMWESSCMYGTNVHNCAPVLNFKGTIAVVSRYGKTALTITSHIFIYPVAALVFYEWWLAFENEWLSTLWKQSHLLTQALFTQPFPGGTGMRDRTSA